VVLKEGGKKTLGIAPRGKGETVGNTSLNNPKDTDPGAQACKAEGEGGERNFMKAGNLKSWGRKTWREKRPLLGEQMTQSLGLVRRSDEKDCIDMAPIDPCQLRKEKKACLTQGGGASHLRAGAKRLKKEYKEQEKTWTR